MTNQTQVSAELSEEQAEAMARARWESRQHQMGTDVPWEQVGGGFKRQDRDAIRAAYAASPGPAMATLITEMQADMSGKTVMSEEAFRELHGKAERLSALEEGLEEMLRDAFVAGCTAVHENYQPDADPDFTEAGYDYAKSTLLAKEQTRG